MLRGLFSRAFIPPLPVATAGRADPGTSSKEKMKRSDLLTQQTQALDSARGRGYLVSKHPALDCWIAWKLTEAGHCLLLTYYGAAAKPRANYRFKNQEAAEKWLAEDLQCLRDREERKAAEEVERKSARKKTAADFYSVGDVFYTSWGYDQTNVEFYQITELKPRSVIVRQVAENCSDHGQPGGGKTQPRRFEFCGPEILCPLNHAGNFSAGPCHGKDKPVFRHSCYKWDGKAKYTSSDY
jgi:hypothetical protein